MRITRIMLASCVGLALAACQTDRTDWGKVAAGTGLVLAGTGATEKIDPKVAQASQKLQQYCPLLRIAAIAGATVTTDEKGRAAALMASAALNEVCAGPITDAPAAVIVAARAYEAARASRLIPPS